MQIGADRPPANCVHFMNLSRRNAASESERKAVVRGSWLVKAYHYTRMGCDRISQRAAQGHGPCIFMTCDCVYFHRLTAIPQGPSQSFSNPSGTGPVIRTDNSVGRPATRGGLILLQPSFFPIPNTIAGIFPFCEKLPALCFQTHFKTRYLADRYDTIGIEDISVKAMAKQKKGGKFSFGKSVTDNGWNMFTNMLEYKLAWQGKQLIKIDKWYPSSQLCHVCGYQNHETKDLSVREWDCPKCGSHHNRDKNAAINIREEARRISA